MNKLAVWAVLLALPSAALAQNLLVNGSFALPGDPAQQACPTGGLHGAPESWTVDIGYLDRNGTVHIMTCPRGVDDTDLTYAYWSDGGNMGQSRFFQTYTFPVGQEPNGTDSYKFSGWYGGGIGGTPITLRFGMVAGTTISGADTAFEKVLTKYMTGTTAWTEFSFTWVPPAGTTQLTAYAWGANSAWGFNAVWFDSFVLEKEDLCPNQPAIDSLSPAVGQRGTTVTIDINGSNFANTPTAQLTGPQTINATSVTVVSAILAKATFNLPANAANGQYNLVYDQSPCDPVTVANGFEIYLESLQNGSFETPGAATACAAEPLGSNYWLLQLIGTSGWPAGMVKNGWVNPANPPTGPLDFLPTCPIVGDNYGTLSSKGSGNALIYYQTIAALPNKQYVVSGKFAASGDINSAIRIFEGSVTGTQIGDKRVANGPSQQFNWRTDFASGTTSADATMITVGWMADTGSGTAMKAVHADGLQVAICDNPITLDPITTPWVGGVGETLTVTNLTGTGFAGTPTIELHGPNNTIIATSVTVVNPFQISFEANLAGATAGMYEVLVIQGSCMAAVKDAVMVVSPVLVNGEFEQPTLELVCDPRTIRTGVPTGWNTNLPAEFTRDHNVHAPTCPCPLSAGGHYGSMTTGFGNDLRAWQTIKVTIGKSYRFAGNFAGGGTNTVKIKLVNGADPTVGTILAETTVAQPTGPGYSWQYASVQASAASELITVVWEMTGASDASATHADGLVFESPCNTPFADTDADGDVDQVDFAMFQLCYTGSGGTLPADPAYCKCLDADGTPGPDNDIDQGDFNKFEACASGAGIAASGSCEL